MLHAMEARVQGLLLRGTIRVPLRGSIRVLGFREGLGFKGLGV